VDHEVQQLADLGLELVALGVRHTAINSKRARPFPAVESLRAILARAAREFIVIVKEAPDA
jgi:hypothetical protein